ncbi:MAG: 6-pyruvoyl-tetrahydropterin synthase-related protein, partial [Anaerolineae bacterium]|nr:6-pyruvoyl-tetrahydropterin synthase-related protein [Anaerolineae bacterium]
MGFRPVLRSRIIPTLVVLALGWPAVRAGIGPTLPCGIDAVAHLMRLVQIDHLWSQGIFFSRLAPDLGWGYGYPVFNFYPPLSYYIVLLVAHLGPGLSVGMRIVQGLTFWILGLGLYFLVREFFREEAAIVAAVAAMYAPYMVYNPLYRGALPEAMGWALVPWVWWAVGQIARTGRRGWVLAGALLYGALLLTHNIAAVVATPLVLLYALMELVASPRSSRRRNVLPVGCALFLGWGLALFFWIPAWVERSLIQWEQAIYGFPGGYLSHFLFWRELLTALEPVRPDLLNPTLPRSLGLVPVLLGTPGLLGLFCFSDARRRQIVFFGAVGAIAALMTTALSLPVWRAIPYLHIFQFPWRFLGLAALSLAFLTGATAELLTGFRGRGLLIGLMVLALVLADLGWLQNARYCPGWDQVSIGSLYTWEQTGTVPATSEFRPRTVRTWPERPVEGFVDPRSLPESSTLQVEKTGPFFAEMWVESPESFWIVVNRFYYPGWRAWVDGREVEVAPEAGWGRLTFPVPAGRHHIVVRFGETPLRLAADVLSALSLLAMAVLALTPTPVFPAPSTGEGAVTPTPVSPPLSTGEGAGG